MTTNTSFGLNLQILSFDLPRYLVKDNDAVRVSITSIPEENKQAFTIPAHKMKDSHITFNVNVNLQPKDIPNDFISTETEKIIVVFRKKSFFSNGPIIASTIIDANDFPKGFSDSTEMKTINIYEPMNKNEKSNNDYQNSDNKKNRQIIGRMQVQMTLTKPLHLNEFKEDQMHDLTTNNSIFDDTEVTYDDIRYKDKYFGFKMLKV